MTVYTDERPFSILKLLLISILLCLHISLCIGDDAESDLPVTPSTPESDPIVPPNEQPVPVNEHVLSDSTTTKAPEIVPNLDSQQVSTAENKSDILGENPPTTTNDNSNISSASATTSEQPATKKNFSTINSFEEWKHQQLHAEIAKRRGTGDGQETVSLDPSAAGGPSNNGFSAPVATNLKKKGKRRKNFASASCGAKILAHNPEAQKPGSVLSSSPDDYMLNPCNAKIWFVIELCESIRILQIEIANFELFSSVPKSFRVFGADRYPTKEWHRHPLGVFNSTFNRTIQGFQTLDSNTYLKYVKIELLDFHGHEHYCPLSVVRVHGSNVEDEIMTMEESTIGKELKVAMTNPEENFNEEEENADQAGDEQVGGIIRSAIMDLAKRVFRRPVVPETPTTTIVPTLENDHSKNNCPSSVIQDSTNRSTLKDWSRNGSLKRCIARFLAGFSFKVDPCVTFLSQLCSQAIYCCQCPTISAEQRRKRTLNLHLYPCGYFHFLTNRLICQKTNETPANKTINVEMLLNATETIVRTNSSNLSEQDQPASNVSSSAAPSINETRMPTETDRSDEAIPVTLATNTTTETKSLNDSANATNVANDESSSVSSSETIKVDLNLTDSTVETNRTNETLASPLNGQNEALAPLLSSTWLKGMLVNTKSLPELFKVIEKLNFNLTLSNRYLQELSQHYVTKLDETQQTTDLLLKASNVADSKLKQYELYLAKFTDNLEEMSERLIKLEAWIPFMVCLLLFLLVWCLWSTYVLIHLRHRLRSVKSRLTKKSDSISDEEEDADEEVEEEDRPVFCNGRTKRKFSTDSNDSNKSRSQRVPDSTSLPKIRENGHRNHHPSRHNRAHRRKVSPQDPSAPTTKN